MTVEYCYIYNSDTELIQCGDTASYVFRYNLLANAGLGLALGDHSDIIQVFGQAAQSIICDFNTVIQNTAVSGAGSQGFSFNAGGAGDPLAISGGHTNNNTCVTARPTVLNKFFIALQDWMPNGTIYPLDSNYIDPTALIGGFALISDAGFRGSTNGVVSVTNNINMVTGGSIT